MQAVINGKQIRLIKIARIVNAVVNIHPEEYKKGTRSDMISPAKIVSKRGVKTMTSVIRNVTEAHMRAFVKKIFNFSMLVIHI